jgi:hypothetical protein
MNKPDTSGFQNSNSVGVRLQLMGFNEQALILARLAQIRSSAATFNCSMLGAMFEENSLPKPKNLSDAIGQLRDKKFVTQGKQSGTWVITPLGRQASISLFSDMDLAALSAESMTSSAVLGQVAHTVVPPTLAPPTLIPGLRKFLDSHPFERNVFGMTRFPGPATPVSESDPMTRALEVAREACRLHGLELHLASDRAISDDLWMNVAAHMWASQYGIAFFEDRMARRLNYNLTIEVGSMLMTGRRCALLKDTSIERMPTDLVGQIYKSVNLTQPDTVSEALHHWLRHDLNLGTCATCKQRQH